MPHAHDPAMLAKAETLVEALPYLQRYAGRTFVVKYGGHAMGDPKAARDHARAQGGTRVETMPTLPPVASDLPDGVAAGDLLIGFDLDAVAEGAKALITPVVLAGEGYALSLEPLDRLVGWQDGVARITALAPVAAAAPPRRSASTVARCASPRW